MPLSLEWIQKSRSGCADFTKFFFFFFSKRTKFSSARVLASMRWAHHRRRRVLWCPSIHRQMVRDCINGVVRPFPIPASGTVSNAMSTACVALSSQWATCPLRYRAKLASSGFSNGFFFYRVCARIACRILEPALIDWASLVTERLVMAVFLIRVFFFFLR